MPEGHQKHRGGGPESGRVGRLRGVGGRLTLVVRPCGAPLVPQDDVVNGQPAPLLAAEGATARPVHQSGRAAARL